MVLAARRLCTVGVLTDGDAPPTSLSSIMVRRTPKPFTVEIRGGRRKSASPIAVDQDQPHVEWPTTMLEELRAEQVAASEPTPSEKPAGRILPSLEQPAPVVIEPAARAAPDHEHEASVRPKSTASLEDAMPSVSIAKGPDTVPSLVPRHVRVRRERAEFARGERWKARLPDAVRKAATKRGRTSTRAET